MTFFETRKKIERNPRKRIYEWLNAGNNWERAEYESFAQIAREIGISPGALSYNLRVILYHELGFRDIRTVDVHRAERQRERREQKKLERQMKGALS